jgi:Na+/melibiose symporter-like transporter
MNATNDSARSELLLYGGSHLGKSVLWQSADAFALYFWSEVVGVERLAAGWLFLIGMIWSGLLDLLVGLLLRRDTADRCRKLLSFGIPASALTFAAMFAAPLLWPQGGLIAAAVTSILFRTAYAAIDVPQNFLMFDIARSATQLGRLSGARTIAGSVIAILVAGATGWLVVPNQPLAITIQHFSLAAGLAAAASAPLLMACVTVQRRASSLPTEIAPAEKTFEGADAAVVFAHLMLTLIAMGVISKTLPYAALEPDRPATWAMYAFLFLTIGKIAGGFVWPGIAARTSVRGAARRAHVASLILLLLAVFIELPTGLRTWALLLALGTMQGGLNAMAWAMLGRRGHRTNVALLVGLFTVAAKLAVGLGGLITAWIAAGTQQPLTLACLVAAAAAALAACLLRR